VGKSRQRSISCSDDDLVEIQQRAKAKGLSVSEYLLALSNAIYGEPGAEVPAKLSQSNDDRSIRRTVWFLYADRLASLKTDGKQN
jgi:hypothetical protein